MRISKSVLICLLLAFSLHFDLRGQAARTPFSSFGLGEYFGNELVHNQGMGGIGVSNPEYFYLNNVNPALLVFNNVTVFGAGIIGEQRTIRGTEASEKSGDGNINYLTLGFPVKRLKWSMSFGLQPATNVDYSLNYQAPIENSTQTVDVAESGSGGINQFSWANGVAITRNFSVGAKANYFFGTIVDEFAHTLSETDQQIVYTTAISDRRSFSGVGLTGGISYRFDSLFRSKKYRLNLGATYGISSDLNTKFTERFERRNVAGIIDSVTLIKDQPGMVTLPRLLSGGISFSNGTKWLVGADFTFQDLSTFEDPSEGTSITEIGNAWIFEAGASLTPDAGSISSYLKRMTYRTGVSLGESPYSVNGEPLRDFGINFGLSLPVNRISSLDLAVQFGQRGDLQKNNIEENYFKLYFGITFNDQWFIKRRFD